LKCVLEVESAMSEMSRPTRGAWIEITDDETISIVHKVAPHAGRVD